MNKSTRGSILIAVGLTFIIAAGVLYVFNLKQDRLAGESAQVLYDGFQHEVDYVYAQYTEEEQYINLGEYSLLGALEIREMGMRLPVLESWNYAMLRVAPCRYMGSIATGDLIIMGHNYQSHFACLESVSEGAEVIFTDAVGEEYEFIIKKIEHLHKTELERLYTTGYPLTLFTCNDSGQERIVVRCEKSKG